MEQVERTYSIDEVRNSARIRDKVRRIDLDTITFATGSAEVPMSQANTLRKVADAMLKVIEKIPVKPFSSKGIRMRSVATSLIWCCRTNAPNRSPPS